jgi:hypothetical protein
VQHKQRFWLALVGAAAGAGWLLHLFHIPAAWFLGPMVAATGFACLRSEREHLPRQMETAAMAIIGSTVSAALTADALAVFVHYWLAILVIVFALLALSLLCGLLLVRISHIDLTTALLGMMPGGAPGMVALSEALGGDTRMVAVMQMLRVMLLLSLLALVASVVLPAGEPAASHAASAFPTAAGRDVTWVYYALMLWITVVGAWVGLQAQLPAGSLVGPALLGTMFGLFGVPHANWPQLVLWLSYAIIGVSVGLQFDIYALRRVGRLLPAFIISMLTLIGSAALMGWLLAALTSIDLFSAYLATAPGGLNMVTIVALDSGANVLLVLCVNLLRFLVIVLAGPHMVRWLLAHPPPGTAQTTI